MTMDEVPLTGRTLILGPLQAGKTRLTAATLSRWIERHGTSGIVVLDLAPTIETDYGVIGGRLDRFIDLPEAVWYGTIEAMGPRSEGQTPQKQLELAEMNAKQTRDLLQCAPNSPEAIFVNDVTIGFQFNPATITQLIEFSEDATCVVLNAFDGEELGSDDPISVNEQSVLAQLRDWADVTIALERENR